MKPFEVIPFFIIQYFLHELGHFLGFVKNKYHYIKFCLVVYRKYIPVGLAVFGSKYEDHKTYTEYEVMAIVKELAQINGYPFILNALFLLGSYYIGYLHLLQFGYLITLWIIYMLYELTGHFLDESKKESHIKYRIIIDFEKGCPECFKEFFI